jgi:lincosamide nucleotidyltransferase A/C/D/E
VEDTDVFAVIGALDDARVRHWLSGGWGVDALVGRQTRPHRDLDLAIDAEHEAAAMDALAALGYSVETDWRPVRIEVAAPGDRWVDIHPVQFDAAGHGLQADLDGGAGYPYPPDGFTTGIIDGRVVPCLSAAKQLEFHTGYPPRAVDRHDIALLDEISRGSGTHTRPA